MNDKDDCYIVEAPLDAEAPKFTPPVPFAGYDTGTGEGYIAPGSRSAALDIQPNDE